MSQPVMVIVGLLFVAVAVAFVLYPLFRPATGRIGTETDPVNERSMLYREILDAELDFRLGKLSESDYRVTSQRLLSRAATLIRADESTGEAELAAQVEQEIAAMRAALRAPEPVAQRASW